MPKPQAITNAQLPDSSKEKKKKGTHQKKNRKNADKDEEQKPKLTPEQITMQLALILSAGADPNSLSEEPEGRRKPLLLLTCLEAVRKFQQGQALSSLENSPFEQRLENAEMLLRANADPNLPSQDGLYPLEVAVAWQCLPLLRLLLKYKANANCAFLKGVTALHKVAAMWPTTETSAPVLPASAEDEAEEEKQNEDKARKGAEVPAWLQREMLEVLLTNGADVNARDSFGQPVIFFARTPAVASLLTGHGANPLVTTKRGQTMAHFAGGCGNISLMEWFVEELERRRETDQKASEELPPPLFPTDPKDQMSSTPSLPPAPADDFEEQAKGEEPEACPVDSEKTEIVVASRTKSTEKKKKHAEKQKENPTDTTENPQVAPFPTSIAEFINLKDVRGCSALHYAAKRGDRRFCRVLLDMGADVTAKTCAGNTPTSLAHKHGHDDVALMLRERSVAASGGVRGWVSLMMSSPPLVLVLILFLGGLLLSVSPRSLPEYMRLY